MGESRTVPIARISACLTALGDDQRHPQLSRVESWREKAAPKSTTGVISKNYQPLKPTWAADIPSALSFGVCKAVSPVEVLIPPHVSSDFTAPCNICLDCLKVRKSRTVIFEFQTISNFYLLGNLWTFVVCLGKLPSQKDTCSTDLIDDAL